LNPKAHTARKEFMMPSCFDAADYFRARCDADAGDLMSNLLLQKLVYYAQGLHLALYHAPLFPESVEAWMHGPAVPALWQKFKEFKTQALPPLEAKPSRDVFSAEQLELLNGVWVLYGQFSARKLESMTQNEAPWKDAELNNVISQESLERFFKTRILN
jgi:uncharacterized phage-associated protein